MLRIAPEGHLAYRSRASASPRNKRRPTRIGNHLHRRAVERFQPLLRQNLFDRALGEALAVAQQISAIGGAQRMIGIVGGEEDAEAGAGERSDLAHDLALIA